MSKSVLVIDTPDTCEKCPIRLKGEPNEWCWVLKHGLDDISKKPDWCQLKPIPEKIPEVSYDSWFGRNKILDHIIEDQTKVKDFAKGWNACIDEITGETE